MESLSHIFVYGTLKSDQCRAGCWPHAPRSRRTAWIFGELYCSAQYPALREGKHRVIGELWTFDQAQVEHVLATLDQIEGTNQGGMPNLYDRVEVEATVVGEPSVQVDADEERLIAVTYRYASDPRLDGFTLLEPATDRGYVQWPIA